MHEMLRGLPLHCAHHAIRPHRRRGSVASRSRTLRPVYCRLAFLCLMAKLSDGRALLRLCKRPAKIIACDLLASSGHALLLSVLHRYSLAGTEPDVRASPLGYPDLSAPARAAHLILMNTFHFGSSSNFTNIYKTSSDPPGCASIERRGRFCSREYLQPAINAAGLLSCLRQEKAAEAASCLDVSRPA